MKKKLIIVLFVIVLFIIFCLLYFRGKNSWNLNNYNLQEMNAEENDSGLVDEELLENEFSSYKVDTKNRLDALWEDVFIYNSDGDLVLSLVDKDQPQYLFALYDNYLLLDSWTSASQRDLIVYDIKLGNKIFVTTYYPWEDGLVLSGDSVVYYKEIDQSSYWDYSLPQCNTEYENWYVEKYGYTIWNDMDADLGDIQCAYFE